MKIKSLFCASIPFITLFSCATGTNSTRYPNASTQERSFSVIAITDFHGGLEAEKAIVGDNQEIKFGGAEAFAAHVAILRKKLGPGLLLDGGDLFQGTMLSNQFEGAPVIKFYKHIGVDAAALGNHEFDFGPIGEKAVPISPNDDAQGALKARIAEAASTFPILGVNVVEESSGDRPQWLKGSIIKTVNGVKVGIIGISDPDTPNTTNALNLVGLKFLKPENIITDEARRLRQSEKVDSVVLVAHMGAICADNRPEKLNDLSSCTSRGILDLIGKIPAGLIDFVSAGHTHRTVVKQVNGTLILQAGSNSKNIGWGKVTIDESGQKNRATFGGMASVCITVMNTGSGTSCDTYELKDKKGKIEPAKFFGEPVIPDTSVGKLFASEAAQISAKKAEKIASVELDQEFTRDYNGESVLGNLVADLQLAMHKDADIGMTNGGGLRANLPAGQLIYDGLFKLAPFDNQLALMTVTGAQLRQAMHIGAYGGQGAYVWSKNVRFNINRCSDEGGENTIENITINGVPLENDKIYRVATSDYLAGGGSGIKQLGLAPSAIRVFWDKEYLLRDGMARVLKKWNRKLFARKFFNPQKRRQAITSYNCD